MVDVLLFLIFPPLVILDDRSEPNDDRLGPWFRVQALVYADYLDGAQGVLEVLSSTSEVPSIDVVGWLGVVAARRGDLETVRAAEDTLEAMAGDTYGWPTHYRAAIAAWMGHRDRAMELLSQSRAEGWSSFSSFHDSHRVLFEPLEAMDDYQALLHPEG